MAFFDKLGEIAKNMTDMAADSLETNELTSKINLEKGKIEVCKRELGEYYYAKFTLGEDMDDEAMLICDKIVVCNDNIRYLEAQREQIKMEREAVKAERKAQKAAEEAAGKAAAAAAKKNEIMGEAAEVLPAEAEEAEEAKETAPRETAEAAPVHCDFCGDEIRDGQKFCGNCGKSVEDQK